MRSIRSRLYENEDPISAFEVYDSILKKYKVIYENKNYVVFQNKIKKSDIILWNVYLKFKVDENTKHHSHFESVRVAKKTCDNLAENKKPGKDSCKWVLKSYLKCAGNDYTHFNWIEKLLRIKEDRHKGNNYYINSNKGSRTG